MIELRLRVWGCLFVAFVVGCTDHGDESRPTRANAQPLPSSSHAAQLVKELQRSFLVPTAPIPVHRPGGQSPVLREFRPLLPKGTALDFIPSHRGLSPRFVAASITAGPTSATVTLPTKASEGFELRDGASGLSIAVALRGAAHTVGQVSEGYVVYPSAYEGSADVLNRPYPSGTEQSVFFRTRPTGERIAYDVELVHGVQGLRLVSNTVEFLDAGGAPRLRMAPPFISGSEQTSAWPTVSVEGCAADQNPAPPWNRPVVGPAAPRCSIIVDWSHTNLAYPALLDPNWSTGQMMAVGRWHHSGARVVNSDGQESALVFGGYTYTSTLSSAELFDPFTKTWTATGNPLPADVAYAPVVTLDNGTALALGGFRVNASGGAPYDGVQAYDPLSGMWSLQGSLGSAREGHTATLLTNGMVLVVGGFGAYPTIFADALLYNPLTGRATPAGTMNSPRGNHTATMLPSGKVLVVGGMGANFAPQSTAEIYDPASGWSTVASPPGPARFSHLAPLMMPSGKVLIAGGEAPSVGIAQTLSTAIFDPASGTSGNWSPGTATLSSHYLATASVLAEGTNAGKVLLAGGDFALNGVELFDPTMLTWTPIAPLLTGRDGHVAIALQDGILFAGGSDSSGILLSTSELYQPDLASTAPRWPSGSELTATVLTPDSATLSWSAATDPNGVDHYVIYEDGQIVAIVPGSSLTTTVSGLPPGGQITFAVQAIDPNGTPTWGGPSVIYHVVPPSASSRATTLDRSVATAIGPATSFLYTGVRTIQTGVQGGTILPSRAAVIRGHVLARDGSALPGVLVTVANHPEFGNTLTQADGEYDLAVNGGQSLLLNYTLADHLSAERVVQVPLQDYLVVKDVTLVALDFQVTAVDVSPSSTSVQVARGSISTDPFGSRRATLLVPPGTQATMTLADGTTSLPATLHVRATEYSVGDTGPSALPGDLPLPTAYTYAVELTADEAREAGARSLTFSQPLSLYVEDFPGLPVGTSVPSGYYDFSRAAWLPSSTGIILKVVGITASAADLDLDGDGIAETGSSLTNLGITDLERRQLATLYGVGQSLWRTALGHFTAVAAGPDGGPSPATPDERRPCRVPLKTTWCGLNGCFDLNACGPNMNETAGCHSSAREDCDYYCCPIEYYADLQQGACIINRPFYTCHTPSAPPPGADGPDDCEKGHASTIACQRQSLGEDIPIAGTPYDLHYESDRQRGRQAQLTIPFSQALEGNPTSIILQVSVAGREIDQTFPISFNASTSFTWDGRDAYGRLLQGAQPVTVKVSYAYPGVYKKNAGFGLPADGTTVGDPTSLHTRLPLMDTTPWAGIIDFWDAQPTGFGGWDLNVHHTYDVAGHVLRFGDGSRRSVKDVQPVVRTLAGNGLSGTNGDGGPATAASVTSPQSVATGFDGSVYIADGHSCIRRVTADGTIRTFAGVCHSPGFSGDNGPAASAQLRDPQDIAIGPDGSVFIADSSNHRIRRIDPGGIIHTIAGSGPTGLSAGSFSGDGGPATLATLNNPTGLDVAVDGTVYVADRDNGRIRLVTPDGAIATCAGTGPSSTSTGTGGPATAAALGMPSKVRLGPDASLFVAETAGNMIRRVGPEGTIHGLLGNGTAGSSPDGLTANNTILNGPLDLAFGPGGNLFFVDQNNVVRKVSPQNIVTSALGVNGQGGFSGDNGLAGAATIGNSRGIRIGADGTLYVASSDDNRIRYVQSLFGGFTGPTGTITFPSDDGRQLYVFDGAGRHQRTVNPLTRATIYSFSYDSDGRVASVLDVDGNLTQFTHDAAGNLTDIVTPFGQHWIVESDDNGYLKSVRNPTGETTLFTYDQNGLMQTKTDARAGISYYFYDTGGRLQRDQDPTGASITLAFSGTTTGSETVMTSPSGVQTKFVTSNDLDGSFSRSNKLPIGGQSSSVHGRASTTVILPGRSRVITTTTDPDPRVGFGMLAPTRTMTTTLPSGLTSNETITRSATYSSGFVSTFTEQTNLNGNTWTAQFDANSRAWTLTSAEGRSSTLVVDSAGRPTQISVPKVTPVLFEYDSHGRLHKTKQGLNEWIQNYDPQGYLSTLTDPLSQAISLVNDPVGRPTQATRPNGDKFSLGYDGNGNLTSATVTNSAAVSAEHVLSYSPVDLLVTYDPPRVSDTAMTTTYDYNGDRKVRSFTRPDGVQVVYGYDPASGLLRTVDYPDGTLSLGYDMGRLQSSSMPGGEGLAYDYDGPLLKGITWSGPVIGSVSRGFDSNYRTVSETVSGTTVNFGYDHDGMLTAAGELTLTPDPLNGRVTGTTLGVTNDSYDYDANGLFAGYTAKVNGIIVYAESVLRYADGRIREKTEILSGETHIWEYQYDPAGRLSDVNLDGNSLSHYGYDGNSNRTTYTTGAATIHPSYDVQDRLSSDGSASYDYTTSGELRTKTAGSEATTYTYDVLGNLLRVAPPSGPTIDYIVDGESRRVAKKVDGVVTQRFLYRDGLHIVAILAPDGTVAHRYVYGTKPNVPDYFATGSGTFRIVSDHLGSPHLVVNATTGGIVERIDYDEFGVVTNDTNRGLTPFGFAGGLYDPDSRLIRFGARDYDASIGRWTTKDWLLFGGGDQNLYAYVNNDPVNGADPLGLWFRYISPDAYGSLLRIWQNPYLRPFITELASWDRPIDILPGPSCAAGGSIWHCDAPSRDICDIAYDQSCIDECFRGLGLSGSLDEAIAHELGHGFAEMIGAWGSSNQWALDFENAIRFGPPFRTTHP